MNAERDLRDFVFRLSRVTRNSESSLIDDDSGVKCIPVVEEMSIPSSVRKSNKAVNLVVISNHVGRASKAASVASQKTKEFGQTVNTAVIKPTKEKVSEGKLLDDMSASVSNFASRVKEGTLLNDVGTSMSGFASKISSVSSKGWNNFQSLWGEPKTTLSSVDTSPGEKSSLLMGTASPERDPTRNRLLSEEDDSWDNWEDNSWTEPKKNGKKQTEKSSDWDSSRGLTDQNEEDEFEAWLNDDTPLQSKKSSKSKKVLDENEWDSWQEADSKSSSKHKVKSSPKSSSKKSSKAKSSDGWDDVDWESGFTSPKKQKEPLVGNLVDLGDNTTVATNGNSGWDNEVWANEDSEDGEWQSLDIGSVESSKNK